MQDLSLVSNQRLRSTMSCMLQCNCRSNAQDTNDVHCMTPFNRMRKVSGHCEVHESSPSDKPLDRQLHVLV
jgi:hypothetical protein